MGGRNLFPVSSNHLTKLLWNTNTATNTCATVQLLVTVVIAKEELTKSPVCLRYISNKKAGESRQSMHTLNVAKLLFFNGSYDESLF